MIRDKTGHTVFTRTRPVGGFTLTEFIVVIVIVSVFVLLGMLNFAGVLRKSTFKAQAQELVSTLQMAASAASESERRYEVILDLTEQSYTLREISSPDLFEVLQEEIIVENKLNENCQMTYVVFDDLIDTDEDHQIAKFRAGHAGWQNGGKILLLDNDGYPYSIIVNRISGIVELKDGDIALLMPKEAYELSF